MKRKTILFLYDIIHYEVSKISFLLFFFVPSSHRITFGNAVLYNQYVVERHKELIEDVDIYNSLLSMIIVSPLKCLTLF